jgi:hypothetical protein
MQKPDKIKQATRSAGTRSGKFPPKPNPTYSCSFVFIRVSFALSQPAPPVTWQADLETRMNTNEHE